MPPSKQYDTIAANAYQILANSAYFLGKYDEAIPQLEAYAGAFLYTHVDGEGLMQGFPIETAARLRRLTQRRLIVAGGICSRDEIDALDALGADTVVGMAVYTELLAI